MHLTLHRPVHLHQVKHLKSAQALSLAEWKLGTKLPLKQLKRARKQQQQQSIT